MPLLILLVSCGYSTYYPDYQSYDGVSCGVAGTDLAELTVSNRHGAEVDLFEVDPSSCAEGFVASLPNGQDWFGSVLTGHNWIVRDLDGIVVASLSIPFGTGIEQIEVIQ